MAEAQRHTLPLFAPKREPLLMIMDGHAHGPPVIPGDLYPAQFDCWLDRRGHHRRVRFHQRLPAGAERLETPPTALSHSTHLRPHFATNGSKPTRPRERRRPQNLERSSAG